MEEYFDHEMFDLKPMYTTLQTSADHATRRSNGMMMSSTSTSCWNSINSSDAHQIIINTNPSSSSSSSVAASTSAPQLISFQNSNTSSYLPTHMLDSDHAAPNNSSDLNLIIIDDKSTTKDYIISSTPPQSVISFSAKWADHDEDDYSGRPDNQYHHLAAAPNGVMMMTNKRVCTASRTPLQAQDHLMAERKRRERLGQLFITLSKLVPGLKKLDKASLLEDAINYLKALQERVNALEEEEVKNIMNMDHEDDINSSSYNNMMMKMMISSSSSSSSSSSNESGGAPAPEIRARISNRHVLIKICCRKQMGLISRIPTEMEKLHLSVIDMRVMPFGGAVLDITILAEMQSEFRGTVKEVVGQLHMSFLNAVA